MGSDDSQFQCPADLSSIVFVTTTSLTATWGTVSSPSGYVLQVSTDNSFATMVVSSVTMGSVATVTGLSANTTYFAQVGALWGATTSYAVTSPVSLGTLANLVQGSLVYQINGTSITANWIPMSAGPGPNTAQGYELDASSTGFDGTGTVYVVSNTNPAVSTLTITGLTPGVAYTLRVGSLNGNGAPNYVTLTNPVSPFLWVVDNSVSGKAWPINNINTTPTLGTAITGFTSPYSLAITPDGNTAWQSDGGGAKVWPINNLKTTPTLGTPITGIGQPGVIAITPDGNTAWVTDINNNGIWPIHNLKTTPTLGTKVSGTGYSGNIVITSDGNTAWVMDNGRIWPVNNLSSTPAVGTSVGGITGATGLAITPDGTTLWVTDGGTGKLWPINNLKTTPRAGNGGHGHGGSQWPRDHLRRQHRLGG